MGETTRDWKAEREQAERAEHANRVAHALYVSDYKPLRDAVENSRQSARHAAVGMMSATAMADRAAQASSAALVALIRRDPGVAAEFINLLMP